ncbi:MAG: response regulator [Kiritimatiellae bacterium]|nr:response regulator [Kiritimatiellia bacterium]
MAKILIIEDDPKSMSFLQKVITRMGHEPVSADNGADGIHQATHSNPDIILTDLRMPGQISDLQLLNALRSASPEIGIVVISGYPSDEALRECKRLNIAEFLTKPFEVGFVRQVVDKLLAAKAGDKTTVE